MRQIKFHIPEELQLPKTEKKMTPAKVKEGIKLLADGESERFVTRVLGISRHTLRIWCKPGYREWYYKNHKKKQRTPKAKARENSLRRYHIISDLYPKEMQQERKKAKERYSKEYFAQKAREFRERHKAVGVSS